MRVCCRKGFRMKEYRNLVSRRKEYHMSEFHRKGFHMMVLSMTAYRRKAMHGMEMDKRRMVLSMILQVYNS